MPGAPVRFVVRAALFVALFLGVRPASAWVEVYVQGHHTRIEVERSGSAVVRHELTLRIRGGPIEFIDVDGIGDGLEPLPDAVVRLARSGSTSQWPLEVEAVEGAPLHLRIASERGLRGGTYSFEFGYRLDLHRRGFVERCPGGTRLTWVGPRLATGVDSARVTFVLPHAAVAPRLASSDDTGMSALLGQVRRGASTDEIELVRTHVARGEPAVWQIVVDEASVLLPTQSEGRSPRAEVPVVRRALLRKGESLLPVILALGFGFAHALLLFVRSRALAARALEARARLRPLIPGGPRLRSVGALFSTSLGAYFALDREPARAALVLVLSILLGAELLPVRVVAPRGPGVWELSRRPLPSDPVRSPSWFEPSSLRGFFLFGLVVLGSVGLAYYLLPRDNYLALMALLALVVPLPLFFTGRPSDLPRSPMEQVEGFQRKLARDLARSKIQIELWGRRALGDGIDSDYDEIRIRLGFDGAPRGFVALEVAFEERAGAHLLPCVVVRVLEDSAAEERLPRTLPWQRGRSPEERVALLSPRAPSHRHTADLVRLVVQSLKSKTAPNGSARPSPKKSRSSSVGSGTRAANGSPPSAVPAT